MLNEILKTIIAREKAALSAYENLQNQEAKELICAVRSKGISLLLNLSDDFQETHQCPQCHSVDDFINLEQSLCQTYDQICQELKDDALKDLFFRLWATSHNEFIPLLCALKEQEKPKFDISTLITDDMREFLDDVKRVVSGDTSAKTISKTLNSPHFGLFSGIAVGGLLAMSIGEFLQNDNEEKKD